MARIYVGRTTGIGAFERHVVLKMILPERANDHVAVQMFLDEARLAASLNHQNVAQVFEVDEDAGIHFLAMEYVHGQDLRALLAKAGSSGTRVPIDLALTVVTGAAAGLHHAHERRNADGSPMGIVHRDVSPSNIMIGYDGAVKLLDFGIAKATSRSVETQSGIIKGKFAYMSPEQCRGRDVDRRSDVFSLGIILYEVTTQHRCFRADSDFDTMHRIVTSDVVRPTRLVQGYPLELEAIVMKALAVDANQRYQSAGLLLEAIESFALAARMSLSTMSLGRFMRDMFGDVPEPWLVSGRINQPLERKEQTISNTNASSSGAGRPPIAHEQAPMHLPPEPAFDPGSDGSAGEHGVPYPAMMPAFGLSPPLSSLSVPLHSPLPPSLPSPVPMQHPGAIVRAALGTQQIPYPQQFPMHPGSGSGPAHGALPQGFPLDGNLHGYMNQPGMSRSDSSHSQHSQYDVPYGQVNLQPNNRMLYIAFAVVLVGIIVLLGIVIADGAPDDTDTSPEQVASSNAPETTQSPESHDMAALRALTPEPVTPETLRVETVRTGGASGRSAGNAVEEQIIIHVESKPAGADVLLDGSLIGTTPLLLRKARGTGVGTLTVRLAGYVDVSTKIDRGSDYQKDVALTAIVDDAAAKPAIRDPKPAAIDRPTDRPTIRTERTERTDRTDRNDRNQRTTPQNTRTAPVTECQPPERYNPYEKNCNGQVCPPCPPASSFPSASPR